MKKNGKQADIPAGNRPAAEKSNSQTQRLDMQEWAQPDGSPTAATWADDFFTPNSAKDFAEDFRRLNGGVIG